jgi:hypothetical protein
MVHLSPHPVTPDTDDSQVKARWCLPKTGAILLNKESSGGMVSLPSD